jgi:hypothetical protein
MFISAGFALNFLPLGNTAPSLQPRLVSEDDSPRLQVDFSNLEFREPSPIPFDELELRSQSAGPVFIPLALHTIEVGLADLPFLKHTHL